MIIYNHNKDKQQQKQNIQIKGRKESENKLQGGRFH